MQPLHVWIKVALAAARRTRGALRLAGDAALAQREANILGLTLTAMHDAWFGSCGVLPYGPPALPMPPVLDRPLALAAAAHQVLRHCHPAQHRQLDAQWQRFTTEAEEWATSIAYGRQVADRILCRPALAVALLDKVANDALPLEESGTAPLSPGLAAPRARHAAGYHPGGAMTAGTFPTAGDSPPLPAGRKRRNAAATWRLPVAEGFSTRETPPWAVLQATQAVLQDFASRRHRWATPDACLEAATAVAVAMADAATQAWHLRAMAGTADLPGAAASPAAAGFEVLRRFIRHNKSSSFEDGAPDDVPVTMPATARRGDGNPPQPHASLWAAMLAEAADNAATPNEAMRLGMAIGHGVARQRGFW